jgi:formate hydrogenlyase subunit 6/NADH:ubiquinone oxidoreductase subunit I
MKIGAMLGNIVGSLFKKPVTERYPFQRYDTPASLRGKLHWDPEKCNGCTLCVKDCPAEALDLIVIDKVAKRFVMRYDVDRCTYCNQCVMSCRNGSLDLSDTEWELAALTKQPFTVYYGRDEDVQFLLEKVAQPGATDLT